MKTQPKLADDYRTHTKWHDPQLIVLESIKDLLTSDQLAEIGFYDVEGYIIKAVNEYPKLVAQRDELLAALKHALADFSMYSGVKSDEALNDIRIVIAKCEAQP